MCTKARCEDHEPPHPASFRFAWGIIKGTKGSDIANLASLEVLARVRLQVKFHATNPVVKNVPRKNHVHLTTPNWCYVKLIKTRKLKWHAGSTNYENYGIMLRESMEAKGKV